MHAPEALGDEGLLQFNALRADAVQAVAERFHAMQGSIYEQFGPRGRDACREDLAFHLEFLRPVLEFGLLRPMVDYLVWLAGVLGSRAIPIEHVALSLEWLAEYFAARMAAPEGAAVATALRAARAEFLQGKVTPGPGPALPAAWPETYAFEAALLAGHRQAALGVVNRCLDGGRNLIDIEQHVIAPALHRIGEKWQKNEVTVAQEHLATAIAQATMTVGLLRSAPPPKSGGRVLLACVEGNHHAVGLQMISDGFQLAGWDVEYLGANMPTGALIKHIEKWQPAIVGLSVSFAQQLGVVKDVIKRLTERLGAARPTVIAGGLAMNCFPKLGEIVGADVHCLDARAAIQYANQNRDRGGAGVLVSA